MDKTLTLDIMLKLQQNPVRPVMRIDITDFYYLEPFLMTLVLAWEGSQGWWKASLVGFIFLHTFQEIRMKFDVA